MSYYRSFTDICNEMKSKISNVDTSEDSYIHNSTMPSAMELSYALLLMDKIEDKSFASKAITAGYSDYLEMRCSEVGIDRKQATYAEVPITITGKVNAKVPKGFIVSTNDNRMYTVETDTIIGADGTVKTKVKASESGSTYNVKAGQINYIPSKISGIISITNENDYTEAYDKETDNDLYQRYLTKVRKNGVSSNVAYIQESITAITGVGSCVIYSLRTPDMQKTEGHVTAVIVDSNGNPASDTLIKKVQDTLCPDETGEVEGMTDIGLKLHVRTCEPLNINISAKVSINSTSLDTVKTTFTTNLNTYLKNTVFNTRTVICKKIEAILMDISGVVDCSDLTINNGIINIPLTSLQLAEVGDINLELM